MIRHALFLALTAAFALTGSPAPAQQVLRPGQISGSGDLKLGPVTLGKPQSDKFTVTPDTLQIQGAGSTGEASTLDVRGIGLSSPLSLRTLALDLPLTPRMISPNACSGSGDDTVTLQQLATLYKSLRRRVHFPGDLNCRISAPIIFLPPVGPNQIRTPPTISLEKSARITAIAAMTSMFVFGSDAADFSGILQGGLIEGGTFNAANLAEIGVRLPFVNNATVRNVKIIDFTVAGVKYGSNSAPQRSYEGFFENLITIRQSSSGAAPAGSACVLYENIGDSHGMNSVLNGCKTGVMGHGVYDSKFMNIHVWNFAETGALDAGYDLAGDNMIVGGQVDGPFVSAFRFRAQRNVLTASSVNYSTYGGKDNVANVVQLDAGATVKSSLNSFKGVKTTRIANEVAGNTTGYQSFGNATTWVVNTSLDRSPGQSKAWATFNGINGTIYDRLNVSSVVRNGIADYTINFTRDMTNINFSVSALAASSGSGSNGVLLFEIDRTRFNVRLRAYDPLTQQYADSSRISVTVFGNDTQ